MKKLYSQIRIPQQKDLHDDSIYTLKLSHFEPQLQPPTYANNYRYDEKAFQRRQSLQGSRANFAREMYNPERDRRVHSSHSLKTPSNENKGELKKFAHLNQQISNLSPILKDKIVELKNLLFKKSAVAKTVNKHLPQNVHFTEYILHPVNPTSPSVLHSRTRKDSSFMKSVKARNLMNRSSDRSKGRKEDDEFRSIQLNNSSKYVKSKRILIEQGNQMVKVKMEKCSNMLKYGSKAYIQRRQIQTARNLRTSHPQQQNQDCRPWQTRLDHLDDDQNIIQL